MPILQIELDQLEASHDQDLIIGLARHFIPQDQWSGLGAGGQSHNAWVGRILRKLKEIAKGAGK